MDTNLIFSIFIIIILTIVAIEWDEAFLLFIIGFISIAIAVNIETVFSISSSTYSGFGNLIQIIYAIVGMFAFIRTISDSLIEKVKKHGH